MTTREKTLAAADSGVAHRREEHIPAVVARNQELLEEGVDFAADPFGLGVELEPGAIDRLNRHRTE